MTNETEPNRTLTAALLQSLAAATWLSPSDQANMSWALFLAAELDVCGDARQIAALGKLYESALHVLRLNPEARSAKTDTPTEGVTPLAVIREIGKPKAEANDSGENGRPKSSRATNSTGRGNRNAATAVAKKRRAGGNETQR